MANFLNTLNQQWLGIIGILISLVSLILSIYSIHRATTMRNQQEQERLLEEIKTLLDIKKARSESAIKKLAYGDVITTGCISNEERIKRETNRYFGRVCYVQLQNIIQLYEKAHTYNFELFDLLDKLSNSAPDIFASLKEALIAEMEDKMVLLSNPNMNEVIEQAAITFYDNNTCENVTYDFKEIYTKYSKIKKLIDVKTAQLTLKLEKKAKKK